MAKVEHGWRGRGKVRVARFGDAVVFHLADVSTRAGPLQAQIRDFCRKEYRGLAPSSLPFAVRIWAELPDPDMRVDADTLGKACLDAFTGILWRDDQQVRRLTVAKVEGRPRAVTIHAVPMLAVTDKRDLAALREKIKEFDDGGGG